MRLNSMSSGLRSSSFFNVSLVCSVPLSYRQLEEMMDERGVDVDHSTIYRWALKYAPELEEEFHKRKKPVGSSWRVDET